MSKTYFVSDSKKFDDPPKADASPNALADGLIESDRGNWGRPVNNS